jgi:hypothetical protein
MIVTVTVCVLRIVSLTEESMRIHENANAIIGGIRSHVTSWKSTPASLTSSFSRTVTSMLENASRSSADATNSASKSDRALHNSGLIIASTSDFTRTNRWNRKPRIAKKNHQARTTAKKWNVLCRAEGLRCKTIQKDERDAQ